MPSDLTADYVEVKQGMGNTDNQSVGPSFETGSSAGTSGGTGNVGVNGSTAKLPFGLDPGTTPVMGSYQEGVQEPATLSSSWYALPERSDDAPADRHVRRGPHLVGRLDRRPHLRSVTAPRIRQASARRHRAGSGHLPAQGHRAGAVVAQPARPDQRTVPPDADSVRIVANDPNLTGDQWLAFTPPRVPKLETLNSTIGSSQPVLLDWAVGLQFPCQRPFDHQYGVAEMPNYRILPDRPLAVSSTDTWQSPENGGPLGFTELLASATAIPTYMRDDWGGRDWGLPRALRPVLPGRHRGHGRHRDRHPIRTVEAGHPAGVQQPVDLPVRFCSACVARCHTRSL